MTREEAIEHFKSYIWNECYTDYHKEACRMAISALRSQADTPPNDPLTVEQIQEMGGEPYWHVGLQEDSAPPHWNILDPFYAKHIEDYGYGKRWLAYRRKQDTPLDRNEETCEYCKVKSCEICVNKGEYIWCEDGECYGECQYFDAAQFCRRCGRRLNDKIDRKE